MVDTSSMSLTDFFDIAALVVGVKIIGSSKALPRVIAVTVFAPSDLERIGTAEW